MVSEGAYLCGPVRVSVWADPCVYVCGLYWTVRVRLSAALCISLDRTGPYASLSVSLYRHEDYHEACCEDCYGNCPNNPYDDHHNRVVVAVFFSPVCKDVPG